MFIFLFTYYFLNLKFSSFIKIFTNLIYQEDLIYTDKYSFLKSSQSSIYKYLIVENRSSCLFKLIAYQNFYFNIN